MENNNLLLVVDDGALRRIIHEETEKAMTQILQEFRTMASGTYTIKEVQEKFKCSEPTIYKKINEGVLHPLKVGKRNVFRCLEVDNLLMSK